MSEAFNIYCDESGHLENDRLGVMVLGAVWCPTAKVRSISEELREIKHSHGFRGDFELKWTKISDAKKQYYLDVLDYFFDNGDLHLRALVIPDKTKLNHASRHQTHDEWYYKMYYQMLKKLLAPDRTLCIYVDIKDTRSAKKEHKLCEVLRNSIGDADKQIIRRLQSVRSHEVELVQVTDLLIGAIGYANKALTSSHAKLEFVKRFASRAGRSLDQSTPLSRRKVNLLIWTAQEASNV